jgi:hypothetical protein
LESFDLLFESQILVEEILLHRHCAIARDENGFLTTKTKRCPKANGGSLLAMPREAAPDLRAGVQTQGTVIRSLDLIAQSLVAGRRFVGRWITCGEGVGETCEDSIAINWPMVTKW